LRVDLIDSLQRRTRFLVETVEALGLSEQVRVFTGRVEDPSITGAVGGAAWVTARAVAPLDRLVRWCLPLLESGGTLLAIKGANAATEIREHTRAVERLGGEQPTLVECGSAVLAQPVTVIAVRRRPPSDKKGRGKR
jgi:16S rRNA (guanine527-N7)-methyltransferase